MALNGEEQSKISKLFQAIGMILVVIAFFLIFASLGFIPNFPLDQNFLNYGIFLLAPAFLFLILSFLTRFGKEVKKLEVFTTLKCQNSSCNHIIIRDFKKRKNHETRFRLRS